MEELQKKKKKKFSKDIVNIIRTTQRNNIELTHIADNKANVLLSLNALMITFLVPMVLANASMIIEKLLYIPLVILSVTCFSTIYIATIVLKPSRFENFRDEKDKTKNFSPFFFGNFYKMEAADFQTFLDKQLSKENMVPNHFAKDLFYVGKRLGFKMTWIRRAFNLFLIGLFLSLFSLLAVLFLF